MQLNVNIVLEKVMEMDLCEPSKWSRALSMSIYEDDPLKSTSEPINV